MKNRSKKTTSKNYNSKQRSLSEKSTKKNNNLKNNLKTKRPKAESFSGLIQKRLFKS